MLGRGRRVGRGSPGEKEGAAAGTKKLRPFGSAGVWVLARLDTNTEKQKKNLLLANQKAYVLPTVTLHFQLHPGMAPYCGPRLGANGRI